MPSPDQREFAALLLRKAEGDVEVVRALVDNASITDDAIGFHAQQAIEKAMKAVLAIHGVQFPRTHDLGSCWSWPIAMACGFQMWWRRRGG